MNTENRHLEAPAAQQNARAVRKLTIVPIPIDFEDELRSQPFVNVGSNIAFEQTEALLPPSAFELWKEYISFDERKRLSTFTHALVHRYPGQVGNDREDQGSRSLMQHVFVCLRIVRPIRKSLQVIQATARNGDLDVYSFTHVPPMEIPVMPVTQTLNRARLSDIQALSKLLPTFLRISQPDAPLYLQRAIRFYEQGYSATTEPSLQLISWMIGIEAMISRGEDLVSAPKLAQVIRERYGKIDIKQPQWRPYLKTSEPLLVENEADHLIELRNCIVHARPLPDYLHAQHSDHLGQNHELAEYLNAAAAMILQSAILQELSKFEFSSN